MLSLTVAITPHIKQILILGEPFASTFDSRFGQPLACVPRRENVLAETCIEPAEDRVFRAPWTLRGQ